MNEVNTKPIRRFFAAMQSGPPAKKEMAALFAEDAVYIEPFSGAARTHRGRDAIMRAMGTGWETPLPDMRIDIDEVHVAGDTVTARWTCHSPAIPGGKGSGVNVFTLRDGQIVRLETRFAEKR